MGVVDWPPHRSTANASFLPDNGPNTLQVSELATSDHNLSTVACVRAKLTQYVVGSRGGEWNSGGTVEKARYP